MAEFVGSSRTVVFVSHNLDVVPRLCGRPLWLGEGRVEASGIPGEVIDRYLGLDVRRSREILLARHAGAPATVERFVLRNSNGETAEIHNRDVPLTIEAHSPSTSGSEPQPLRVRTKP